MRWRWNVPYVSEMAVTPLSTFIFGKLLHIGVIEDDRAAIIGATLWGLKTRILRLFPYPILLLLFICVLRFLYVWTDVSQQVRLEFMISTTIRAIHTLTTFYSRNSFIDNCIHFSLQFYSQALEFIAPIHPAKEIMVLHPWRNLLEKWWFADHVERCLRLRMVSLSGSLSCRIPNRLTILTVP